MFRFFPVCFWWVLMFFSPILKWCFYCILAQWFCRVCSACFCSFYVLVRFAFFLLCLVSIILWCSAFFPVCFWWFSTFFSSIKNIVFFVFSRSVFAMFVPLVLTCCTSFLCARVVYMPKHINALLCVSHNHPDSSHSPPTPAANLPPIPDVNLSPLAVLKTSQRTVSCSSVPLFCVPPGLPMSIHPL